MALRKCESELLFPENAELDWYVVASAASRVVARSERDDIWEVDGVGGGLTGGARGASAVYQCALGGNVSF